MATRGRERIKSQFKPDEKYKRLHWLAAIPRKDGYSSGKLSFSRIPAFPCYRKSFSLRSLYLFIFENSSIPFTLYICIDILLFISPLKVNFNFIFGKEKFIIYLIRIVSTLRGNNNGI